MEVFRSLDEIVTPARGSAIAIGKFDGVHRGHRAILGQLSDAATERNLETVVFTFDENPLSVIAPERCPNPLASPEQRLAVLRSFGIDATVMIPFDERFSGLTPQEFVRDVLVTKLDAKHIIVGHDFRFGHGGAGNSALLTQLGGEYGFTVTTIADVAGESGERVSSTMIREALSAGDVTLAGSLLGRHARVTGTVVTGDARGRTIGFPTANVDGEVEGFIPADGVYAGWLIEGDEQYPAAISIGTNPTFAGERTRRVEAYVLDQSIDLYNARVHVDFVEMIRPTLKFDSVDELIAQMNEDVQRTREILAL